MAAASFLRSVHSRTESAFSDSVPGRISQICPVCNFVGLKLHRKFPFATLLKEKIIMQIHPALYGFVTGPGPQPPVQKPPAPPSPYAQLKELEQRLDRDRDNVAVARNAYSKTLEQFATLCRELWQKEKAQGSRQGKGFRQKLKTAGIDAARAYRAMKKYFPHDFPVRKKRKSPTSFAANKVANPTPFLRFTRERRSRTCLTHASQEVLELAFTLTAQQKTEFLRCLKVVGADQLPQLLLQAMKQAAEAIRTGQQTPTETPEEQDTPQASPRKPPRSDHGCRTSPRKDSPKASAQAAGAPNKTPVFSSGP